MASDADLVRAFAATFLLGEPTHPARDELMGVLLRPASYTGASPPPPAALGGMGLFAPSHPPAHAWPLAPLGAPPSAQPYYSAPPPSSWHGNRAPHYPSPYSYHQLYPTHAPPPATWPPPPAACWPHAAPGWQHVLHAESYAAAAPQPFVPLGERAHTINAGLDSHRSASALDHGCGLHPASTPRRVGGRARAAERASRPRLEADERSDSDAESRRSDESAQSTRAPSAGARRSAQPDERTAARAAPTPHQATVPRPAARQPPAQLERRAQRRPAAAEAAPHGAHATAEARPTALALARASALALLDELAVAADDGDEASNARCAAGSESASELGVSRAQSEPRATVPSDTAPLAVAIHAAPPVRLANGSRVIVRASGEHCGKRGVVVALDSADVIVQLDGGEGGILQSAVEVLSRRDVALVAEAGANDE